MEMLSQDCLWYARDRYARFYKAFLFLAYSSAEFVSVNTAVGTAASRNITPRSEKLGGGARQFALNTSSLALHLIAAEIFSEIRKLYQYFHKQILILKYMVDTLSAPFS